ncbi:MULTISPECIES: DUF1934 domain-containing protein [Lysinibacillus]|uniref:DUF1934 domain-containing protein n=1 Tax=Lysinibacillus antri TaxID=2498145 RepID=A0A3S0WGH3_9BACI|nr:MULTISPECIES: DUF1934 domain-containing protein [Lysinibacillus]RUL53130.1 DUF1934 domain-containing protein [Lysinibacillus antri]TSI07470.1 DUF1934 domain-containing protein [Lysinibacillus sp. BW-2-10]
MNTFEKSVKIKLNSTIQPIDGEPENYEMWLNGSYINKAGKTYLRYEEVLDDKSIQTTVKMDNLQALILRSGGVKMRLPFNSEKQESGHYDTQFGTLPILTETHQLTHDHEEEHGINGNFKVQYDLIISGQSVGKYTLEIHYSEGQK